jgi:Putative zinc-finger
MECKKVVPLLSEYIDGVLDAALTEEVSQHVHHCLQCRKELKSLSAVRARLGALNKVQAPAYFGDLVRFRLANARKNRWQVQLRDALELHWSRIRTTERIWYMTRAAGTIMTAVFFFLIPYSIDPLNIEVNASNSERTAYTMNEKQLLSLNFGAKMGMLPEEAQRGIPVGRQSVVKPAINNQYLSNFGESISQDGEDYDFSVVTSVDRSGQAKARSVIEHPNAQNFLESFNKVISPAIFAPGRKNGKAVDSSMILIFSKISVYD